MLNHSNAFTTKHLVQLIIPQDNINVGIFAEDIGKKGGGKEAGRAIFSFAALEVVGSKHSHARALTTTSGVSKLSHFFRYK